MSFSKILLMALVCVSQMSFAQETGAAAVSTTSEKSYFMDSIQIQDDQEDQKEKAYESVNSETVISKKEITKGNASDVKDVLQKVPGVSVIGGGESQNKKVTVRGLSGYRVIQTVDGAQRVESTQAGMTSGVFVEPEMLSEISVQNGADSVSSINGAIGGTVQYKTITPEDILIGKQDASTKLKVSGESAVEGSARSVHSAARLSKNSSVLVGVTLRDAKKSESGAPDVGAEQRETEEANSNRSTYLAKYVRKTMDTKTDVKAEYSDAATKKAAYMPGYGDDTTNYQTNTFEAAVNHEQKITSNFKYEVLSYYNNQKSIKDTLTAYRNIPSTIGRKEDGSENAGVKLAGVSLFPVTSDILFQSKNGVEGAGNRISESDGSANPFYGDSQGYDSGVFTENSLSFSEDTVVLMAGARYSQYHRESTKLALNVPSKTGDTVSTMLGMSYSPADWVKISGKVGVANRAPNVREMYYGDGTPFRCHSPSKQCSDSPNPNLNPEMAYTREVSVLFKDTETAQPRRLKLTYFDDTINDYISSMPEMFRIVDGVRVPAGPSTATHREYSNRNLSTVLRRGVEAQAQVEYGNWDLGTMYSKIRMECQGCADMYSATTVTEPLPTAPADKYGVSASYDFRSIDLEVGVDAQFVSAQRDLSDRYLLAGYATPAYDVYGFNMRWTPKVKDLGEFEVGFGVSNIFDRKYKVHASPTGTFELGRNYSLSLASIF